MEFVVTVSADERARRQLSPETERAAHAAFRQHGCLVLRGVFAPSVVDGAYRDYVARYGALGAREMTDLAMKPPPNPFIARGHGRYQITPRWEAHYYVEYDRLLGGAAASPLVQLRGSPNQVTVGLGASYSFDVRVP